MSSKSAHLTEWTLEQLAEGMLSKQDLAQATAHVEACARCRAELDAYRTLFVALEGLPRFAPSPAFGDAVMARVRIAPQQSVALARLRRWLPTTQRGWILLSAALVAPAIPVIALVVWVLTQPLVSTSMLWQWTSLQVQEAAQTAAAYLVTWSSSAGLAARGEQVYTALSSIPLTTLGAVLGILAIAIPLSAWSLVRLTRTPMEDVTYAN